MEAMLGFHLGKSVLWGLKSSDKYSTKMCYRNMHLKATCVAGHIPTGLHLSQWTTQQCREYQWVLSMQIQLINSGYGGVGKAGGDSHQEVLPLEEGGLLCLRATKLMVDATLTFFPPLASGLRRCQLTSHVLSGHCEWRSCWRSAME